MAIWRSGKPTTLLHRADRGKQDTREPFQRLMTERGAVCSRIRSGNVWDNAAMESFVFSLKAQQKSRRTYRTRHAARADVFDVIERFYDRAQLQSTLGYRGLLAFEKGAKLARTVSTNPAAGESRGAPCPAAT